MLRRRFLTSTLATMLAPSLARAQDRRPLRIGWVFAMANAPVLVAQAKGFFDGEGLQVDIKSFGDGPVIQQAVAAGEIDVAYIGRRPSINGLRAASTPASWPR